MSTRSLVAMTTKDGYMAIYNHSDGYPEGVGADLVAEYNSTSAAKRLMKKGDGSYLDSSYRDRGETDVDAHTFSGSISELCQHARDNYWGEYVYVWDGKGWRCWDAYNGNEKHIPGNKYKGAKKLSQREQILQHWEDNSGIGAKEARQLYGIKCLSARICELRKEGHDIQTEPDHEGAVYYPV